MNPASLDEAVSLAKVADVKELVIAPPFPFLGPISNVLRRASLGAQDLSSEDEGPFTGQVSASQLGEFGVKYVIVGHSERRRHLGETDEMVARKLAATLKHRMIPILCVGETREERTSGVKESVVERQLKIGLSLARGAQRIIIAYEPLWAISSTSGGQADTAEDTVEMVRFMRGVLEASGHIAGKEIIYGGSVNSKNVDEFLTHEEIAGALVGAASLKKEEIKKIIKSAASHE